MKYIDNTTPVKELEYFLNKRGWLKDERILEVEIPGEGNMNVVLRVQTDLRTFILKQSRPYAQKYQQVKAPISRIDTEFKFYNSIKGINNFFPQILAYDKDEYLIQMEDLGKVEDFTEIYDNRNIASDDLQILIQVILSIHNSRAPADYPQNLELRRLNHQHIFVLPFIENNGLNLDDVQLGLAKLSLPFKKDNLLKEQVEEMGKLYLSQGEYLLHGDYYPGSWMKSSGQIYVIDPEFSFVGFREFDLGVMTAHLTMATMKEDQIKKVVSGYGVQVDTALLEKMTGIEIARRLLGLAQLPLQRNLDEKKQLLQFARKLILK